MMQPQGYGYGPPSSRQETPLFAAGGVQVTTARFVCWSQTYPIGGITSVSPFAIQASRLGWYLWAVWSAFWAMGWIVSASGSGAGIAIFFGVASIVSVLASIAFAVRRKNVYGVMITTAGMNVKAVVSADQAFVQQIVGALNQALSIR